MGDSKLCLLLLLSTSALAFAQDEDQPTCLLAKRYKTLHKYEYQYEAESLNAINGASLSKHGPKASCMVEIEVPQTCSFIVRTSGCSLSEVYDMDTDGSPMFRPASGSDAFAAEMEKYPLKVVVEGEYDVKLYPEEGETTTILNIKRGIISALAVPLLEEEKNKNMPTIHGMCKTYYTINAREDIATDISLNRDLSRCDKFVPMRDHTSPLALISGMHYPLAQLVRSSQTCNYKFDNEKKHMTSGSCTENHILIPFSHKGEYGVTNVGKQELTLVQVSPHNDRVFDRSERRAHLFHKLVTMVRGMKTETLSPAIPEALAVSRVLTYQVLAQCGTPECSSAIMQILRTFDSSSLEVDAAVFAMGLVSNPSALLINDMLEMAKYKISKPIMYALSNVVKRFYKTEGKLIPEIYSVAEFMAAQLGDCSGHKDNTFMTLRVIGNMAPAVVPASPALRAAVIQCVNQPAASLAVQQAAIQGREVLMQVLLDSASPMQKRIAAYLVLMKDPQPSELAQLTNALPTEQDKQVMSFVISHITNILSSTEPETQELRQKIRDALQGNEIGPIMDPTKFSRNYKIGSMEGNMIFEGTSYLPKEVMLEMTLKAFGYDIDMMEVGMEGKGFEPTVDALFGENGFFPDTALKTMYFVADNMPLRVNEILQNMLPAMKKYKMERQASQNLMREIGRNLNKLVTELKSTQSPEAMVYMRLLGNELGYLRTNDMERMAYSAAMMIDSMFKMFPTDLMKELMTKADNSIFAHYIFMDNEFFLPTVTGVPLRIALSGTFTPGIKGGLKIARDMSEVAFMPSAGIEFVTQVGSYIPEYVNSGLEMHTNIFHESGLSAKISMERDQVKLTIPAPQSPTKLIKMTNNLVAVTGSEVRTIPPMVMDKVDVSECTPFFAGMKYCTALQYTDAFSQQTAPYFPFNGDSKITNDARFNSQPMRFDHTIRCSIVPFDFNLDAIFNADGDMTMYGKQSAQLYGKFLLKAQPLAFASSHECRASVTQQFDNGFSLETTFDNKMDTVLSLQEQKTSFRVKSKINEHAFNQDMSVYNTAERTGMEISGTILTNIINTESTENQEFTISGFLKYDKNTNSHIIQFPLIENLPVFMESIKGFVVHIAEALQDYINNEEIRAKLEALPQYVSEFVSQLNIDGKVIQLKQYFNDFTQQYVISMEDVEDSLRNLKVTVEKLLADLSVYIQHFADMMKEIIVSGTLPETLIQKIQQQLNAINEDFDIKAMVVYMIDTMREMIQQIHLERSSVEFLRYIENNYEITLKLKMFLNDMKNFIENFDMSTYVAELKTYISSINFKGHIEELVSQIPTEIFSDISKMIRDLDIVGKINTFYANMRELIVKFEVDKKVQAVLEKVVEVIEQFKIDETIRAVAKMVKDADIPTRFTQAFQGAINYLKATEVRDIIGQLNMYIESIVQKLNSLDYNDIVDLTNQFIAEYTMYVNELIRTLEIPQKLEATRDFVNFVLSSAKGFMDHLREIKVAEMMKSVKEMIDQVVFDDLKRFFEFIKQEITNLDVKAVFGFYLETVSEFYREVIVFVTDVCTTMVEMIKKVAPEQKIISEIQQIIDGLITELKKAELNTPSFIVPLTNLIVPSMKFRMDEIQQFEIPTQLDIPEFTIMGFHTVEATTISFDDIKQKIIEIIDFIVNFEIKMLDSDAFFGDLTLNYLPSMPEINLPEITLPEISFPTIPQVPIEKLVKSLQVPEIKLPTIPSEIMVPCFGKLYGEIRFQTPIYTVKTSAEFQNSTENEMTPKFTGFLISQGTSPSFEILNYKFDSTAHIAIPKMSRVVLAETLKFNHLALGVDHQASVTLYGRSAQAQAKTAVKVTTTPYTADLMNTAFIAMEGGVSAALDTTYNHLVNFPIINVRSDATVTQKVIARQDGYTLTLTVDNVGNGKFNAEEGNHKSNLHMSLTPSIVTLTFSGDTDSTILKMKQQITAESGTLVYFKFNIRNEAEAPIIKNSLVVASGHANLYDMKIELKANHDTELYGAVTGVLSNGINIIVQPIEFVFEFQNKGNAKVNIFETLIAKIDLQNDYSAIFKPDSQQMNTVSLARLNQYKMSYNFTVSNNENEAGVFVAMESEADLDFLRSPISIPEIDLPFVDFRTPAISDLNLYEQTGLKQLLTTTEQTVDVDAKIVYQKMKAAPMGNMITELSFKSAIINLNVNAGLYAEDDLVFRMGATTTSVFEGLKAKLDGTTSLTTKRGIKLANSLSLENSHIEGTHDSTFVSSLYTTNLVAEVEGDAPVFKVTFKSSATSGIVFLEYDMDGSTTANFENEALSMNTKVVLTHADLTMDVNHVITQALRRKRQVDDSVSRHTLNVDITSPTFTDVNLRYAARRDGISASVSTPSTGFLGLQFNGRVPSQMGARVYGRYPSAPEVDVDILVIRTSSKDADKMNLQIAYNMETPKVMLSEFKTRLPSIISSITVFADKYQITKNMEELKNSVVNRINEAYNDAINYDVQMSQLSIFFRNIIVQYQKTVQVFLDAVVKVLRETQFKLPGSEEMTTLPEVLKQLTSSIAAMLDKTIQIIYENMEVYYNSFVEKISSVKLRMPVGDAITGGQIFDQVKTAFKNIFDELVDFVKNMESLDTMLVKIGDTLKAVVEKSEEFVDSVKSDYLDAVFININVLYRNFITVIKTAVNKLSLINQRYKAYHKYEYLYEAESLNAVNGASHLKNGPKATCKVEIEVPQACSFNIRTTGCSLSEVVNIDTEGNPMFSPAPGSDAFAAEMERYPLKVVVEGVYDVKLYPEDGETTTILNIKRGIISGLAVPLLEEDKNKNMPTIHGMCKTHYSINAREDIATDISLSRDLSTCDKFVPMRDHTSPLALISGMHYPLAQLVRSSQTCNYKFDNEKKHMTSGSCTENHILIPFSHKGEYGITNIGKQELTLVQVSPHNDRVFDRSDIALGLHMEAVEDKSASQNLMREIGRNLNKLVTELKSTQSPEAMVYMRLLGNELGYLRTNEMEEMAYSAAMMIDSMFKMFPTDLMKELMTKADNTIFAHYIFMDNEFFLPTVTGVPLRIALSGTFTPGIKGGLKIVRDMSEVAFMPSAGIEFATQFGSHIPEYVNSGLEIHTNIFHESGLSAKISMERDQVKLTIPAPKSSTKLIKMTNTLVAVTGSEVRTIPPMLKDEVDVSECTPFFAGMKYCTALKYTDAFSQETAPYFPFTGDSKFAVELHPTGEVTEYTATVAYELLREGEEGRQKVDSVKFVLRAEGAEPTEARAIMKYNRRKNVITADFQIPDYDVEAGFRLGVVDGNTKGKGTHSISLDLINKNIPQLSLVGRANLKAMREGMLQVQLLVPSINTDATVTANLKREEELELQLKSEIKVMDATSEQKI
eukprot:superscaffoldBa00000648_g6288